VEYPAGSEVAFDLTLVGRARQYLAHFVVTLREVDRMAGGGALPSSASMPCTR
jgi:hypothetical protein